MFQHLPFPAIQMMVLFLAISLSPALHAASYDCDQKLTAIEQMVCEDKWLSAMDEEMARLYEDKLEKGGSEVRQEQRQWLKDVRNRCSDVNCLRNAYKERLVVLQKCPEQELTERERLKQLSTQVSTLPLSIRQDYSEAGFCNDFLNDFRTMQGIEALEPSSHSKTVAQYKTPDTLSDCPRIGERFPLYGDEKPDDLWVRTGRALYYALGPVDVFQPNSSTPRVTALRFRNYFNPVTTARWNGDHLFLVHPETCKRIGFSYTGGACAHSYRQGSMHLLWYRNELMVLTSVMTRLLKLQRYRPERNNYMPACTYGLIR